MKNYEEKSYGIVYRKVKVQENSYMYIPINLVEGKEKNNIFFGNTEYQTFTSPNFLQEEYVVGEICSV